VLKVELHSHTSDDPVDRIPHSTIELIDRAIALRYDALAITLHDAQLDPAPWQSYAADHGLLLIAGIERTIEGKHVLLLNFSPATQSVKTFEDLAALKRDEDGLVIAPHPFFPHASCVGRELMDRHADVFDAVEYNAMFTRGANFNRAAARWAHARGKPLVGNGDVHRLRQLGSTFSLVDSTRHPAAICAAIKTGRVEVVASALSWPATASLAIELLVVEELRDWLTDGAQSRIPDAQLPTPNPAARSLGLGNWALGIGTYPRKNL